MKKLLLVALIALIPMSAGTENITASEADSMVGQMKTILDQYALKIRALEAENTLLREEMRKAGIKIPLSLYSGAIIQTIASSGATTIISTGAITSISTTNTGTQSSISGSLVSITSQYGSRYAGFISRIHNEWNDIRGAYKLPATAHIGGYEFVKQGLDNNVFVDIVYKTPLTASGLYDAKILYEYNTGTYQRKLIGFFELDRTTGFYKTRTGTNPFAGVARIFIRDPIASISNTSTTNTSTSTGTTPSNTTRIPSYAEIEKAYSDKRYLSVISLSDTYLTANTATYDLLRIRYRTYFIIGKYTEALSEVSKIESMGKMTSTVACDAKVIATYSKDTSLITKYTSACK